MIRSLCVVLALFLCSSSYAHEKTNGPLLSTPVKITMTIADSKVSASTISETFSLSGEGKEKISNNEKDAIKESSSMSWGLSVHGRIVKISDSGLYTIQVEGRCQYFEEVYSSSKGSEAEERSEIQVEMSFESGTRLKLGQEKVIASQNDTELKIRIELDE